MRGEGRPGKINPTGKVQLGAGNTSNEELQKIADRFYEELRSRKFAPGSIKKRRDSVRKFLLYMERTGVKRFQDVDLKMLDAYRLCLVEHNYSDYVIESDQRSVILFFRFLEEQNIIFDDPAKKMKIRKAPERFGAVLTEKEVHKLLSMPDLTKQIGIRDRALIEVLYSTGIRRSEAAALTLFDVDLERGTIKVTGKFSKQRILPLGKLAVKFLGLYIKECRPKYLPKFSGAPDALWLHRARCKMKAEAISQIMHRYARDAGMKLDTHTLRRTCATHLLRGGAHPAVVAQMLGHKTLTTLSHYLETTISDLKKAHAQSNPGK